MKTSFLLTGLAAATVAFARVYEGVSEQVAVRHFRRLSMVFLHVTLTFGRCGFMN